MWEDLVQAVSFVQKGDQEILLSLIEKFTPLFRKYSNLLQCADIYSELVLFFIEKIKNIEIRGFEIPDGHYALIAYLNRCIRNHYIYLSKRKAQYDAMISIEEIEVTYATKSRESSDLEFFLLISTLTDFHRDILTLIFYEGYSVQEVAEMKHISRQAVNQAKNRALQILRKIMNSE